METLKPGFLTQTWPLPFNTLILWKGEKKPQEAKNQNSYTLG